MDENSTCRKFQFKILSTSKTSCFINRTTNTHYKRVACEKNYSALTIPTGMSHLQTAQSSHQTRWEHSALGKLLSRDSTGITSFQRERQRPNQTAARLPREIYTAGLYLEHIFLWSVLQFKHHNVMKSTGNTSSELNFILSYIYSLSLGFHISHIT